MTAFEDLDKALNNMLTALIACQSAADQARELAHKAQEHAEECEYWANKFKLKVDLLKGLQ